MAAEKEGGVAVVCTHASPGSEVGSTDTATATATVPLPPPTPVQQAMTVLYKVKAVLDKGIITLFYVMLPLLLWILMFGKK